MQSLHTVMLEAAVPQPALHVVIHPRQVGVSGAMGQIAKLLLSANPGIAVMAAEVLPLMHVGGGRRHPHVTLLQAGCAEAAVMLLRSGSNPRASLERWAGETAVMLKAAGPEAAPRVHCPAGSKASKMTAAEPAGMSSAEAARVAAAEPATTHMGTAHVTATAHMTSAAVSATAVMLGEGRSRQKQG